MQASLLAQSAEASANEAIAAGDIANTAVAKAASLYAVQAYNQVRNIFSRMVTDLILWSVCPLCTIQNCLPFSAQIGEPSKGWTAM